MYECLLAGFSRKTWERERIKRQKDSTFLSLCYAAKTITLYIYIYIWTHIYLYICTYTHMHIYMYIYYIYIYYKIHMNIHYINVSIFFKYFSKYFLKQWKTNKIKNRRTQTIKEIILYRSRLSQTVLTLSSACLCFSLHFDLGRKITSSWWLPTMQCNTSA